MFNTWSGIGCSVSQKHHYHPQIYHFETFLPKPKLTVLSDRQHQWPGHNDWLVVSLSVLVWSLLMRSHLWLLPQILHTPTSWYWRRQQMDFKEYNDLQTLRIKRASITVMAANVYVCIACFLAWIRQFLIIESLNQNCNQCRFLTLLFQPCLLKHTNNYMHI